jgi:hypothetical protein
MLKNLFHAATYWAPALLICVLIGARLAAPFPYGGPDFTQSVTESLSSVARELSYRNEVYVKVDGGDPGAEILTELNDRKLPPTFSPWSARSPDRDHCRPTILATAPAAGCMLDNFLAADFLTMPFWHVALVRVKSAGCTAELTVVRGVTRWHVMSQRATCN